MKKTKLNKINNTKLIVTVIVITYNNEDTIERCITSIKNNKTSEFEKRIIVIDNDSSDKTWEILNQNKDALFKLRRNEFNDGFGRAINKVFFRNLNSDFFFLLNADATLGDNSLQKILETANNNPAIGLLSCKIIDPKTNKVIFNEGAINFLRLQTTHSRPSRVKNRYVTGCALLVKKDLVSKIGGFDPKFFLYYEDADFSKRALAAGFKIDTEQKSICYHNESHSSNSETKTYFLVRNGLSFFKKHYPKIALPYFYSLLILRLGYHSLFSKKKIVNKAMLDFIRN